MFEDIFFPLAASKHRSAPLADQRAEYLVQLKANGARRTTLRKQANAHLNLVRLLDLRDGDRIGRREIDAAAALWTRPQGRRCSWAATSKARQRFVSRCIALVRYLGWLEDAEGEHRPHPVELRTYEHWLRDERGLAKASVDSYGRAAGTFLQHLDQMGVRLDALEITDVDRIAGEERQRGRWSRRTIHDFAQRVRSFVGFAEKRGWCRPGLAAGIVAPGYRSDETIPKGIERRDVERLLASVEGPRRVDRRDRAILMPFATFGLRAGEVSGLSLDDFDWENELLCVHCPKPGRTHLWPLSHEVGDAILDYIQNGRPTGFGRSLFFTSCAPIHPLGARPWARLCATAWPGSAWSPVGEDRMRSGTPPPSTFWTKAWR